eukprot:COSAG02_NODE_43_length_45989_cov_93.430181_47_plen_125_part_00
MRMIQCNVHFGTHKVKATIVDQPIDFTCNRLVHPPPPPSGDKAAKSCRAKLLTYRPTFAALVRTMLTEHPLVATRPPQPLPQLDTVTPGIRPYARCHIRWLAAQALEPSPICLSQQHQPLRAPR